MTGAVVLFRAARGYNPHDARTNKSGKDRNAARVAEIWGTLRPAIHKEGKGCYAQRVRQIQASRCAAPTVRITHAVECVITNVVRKCFAFRSNISYFNHCYFEATSSRCRFVPARLFPKLLSQRIACSRAERNAVTRSRQHLCKPCLGGTCSGARASGKTCQHAVLLLGRCVVVCVT